MYVRVVVVYSVCVGGKGRHEEGKHRHGSRFEFFLGELSSKGGKWEVGSRLVIVGPDQCHTLYNDRHVLLVPEMPYVLFRETRGRMLCVCLTVQASLPLASSSFTLTPHPLPHPLNRRKPVVIQQQQQLAASSQQPRRQHPLSLPLHSPASSVTEPSQVLSD